MGKDSTKQSPGLLQKELRQSKPFPSLQTEAFLNLVRTTGQLQHILRSHLKPYGITETQYNCLRILKGAGTTGLTCAEISERLVNRDPDITRLVARLERIHLVQRERDAKDRRIVVTRISAQGLERLRELDQVVTESITASLASLNEKELKAIIRLLERVRSANSSATDAGIK